MTESFLDAVLNSLWQGTLLALLVWLVLRDMPRLSAATRLAIWQLTLAVVLLLPALRQIPFDSWLESPRPPAAAPSASSAPSTPLPAPPRPVRPVIELTPDKSTLEPFFVLALLLALWQLSRLAVAYLVLVRWKRKSSPAGIALPAFLRRSARVLVSAKAGMPMAVGYLRPAILIPENILASVTPEELRLIVLHEAAHLERRDDWTVLLERIIRAIFALHPALYIIGRQLDREREMACDDWVVAHAGAAKPYAQALVRVAELASLRSAPLLAAGAGRRHEIFGRMEALLDNARNRMPSASSPLVFIAAALLLFAVSESTPFSHLLGFSNFDSRSVISDSQHRREFNIRGEIDFAANDQDVAYMAPGARLVISDGDRWASRRVELEAGPDGEITRLYFVSGVRRSYDDEAKRLLARELSAWLRDNPNNLTERLARWLKAAGPEGALREIRGVRNTQTKRLYLEALAEERSLNEEQLRRILKAAAELDSDGEKRAFFENAAPYFTRRGLHSALLTLVDTIHSDGDRRHLLGRALPDFAPASHPRLLRSISLINSDGEKTALLSELLAAHPEAIASDFFTTASRIHSDGDKARLLTEAAARFGDEESTQTAYFAALHSIQSSGDQRRVLETLLARPNLRPATRNAISLSALRLPSGEDREAIRVAVAARP